MFEKLKAIQERYNELTEAMGQPEVTGNFALL